MAVLFCGFAILRLTNAEACFTRNEHTTIAGISPLGDIRLASDSRVHLADIALPDDDHWREKATLHMKDFTDTAVTAETDNSPDRWGRYRARLTIVEKNNDLAEDLVRNGLAIVDSGEASHLCRASLLAVEQQARSAKVGLWSNTKFAPIAAAQTDELLRRIGRFTLVEGRVRSVGERGNRTYLNFGRDWKTDFTVTISKQVWADMQQSGIGADRLKGSTIRLRGVIREWNGPSLDVLASETVEVITDVRSHTGETPSK